MLSFLLSCIALAVCIAIGFFLLNVVWVVFIALIAGISSLWAYLRKPTTEARRQQEGK